MGRKDEDVRDELDGKGVDGCDLSQVEHGGGGGGGIGTWTSRICTRHVMARPRGPTNKKKDKDNNRGLGPVYCSAIE